MSRNLSFTKFSLRINNLYFLIYLSLILSIPLLSFVFLKYFSLAELATIVLDEKGYRDLQLSSINFLSISFNSFVLIFFSFFSSSAAKVFYVFFNLTLLYALYRSTFRVGVIFSCIISLYVLPYSLTIVNSGNACRVLLQLLLFLINYRLPIYPFSQVELNE